MASARVAITFCPSRAHHLSLLASTRSGVESLPVKTNLPIFRCETSTPEHLYSSPQMLPVWWRSHAVGVGPVLTPSSRRSVLLVVGVPV